MSASISKISFAAQPIRLQLKGQQNCKAYKRAVTCPQHHAVRAPSSVQGVYRGPRHYTFCASHAITRNAEVPLLAKHGLPALEGLQRVAGVKVRCIAGQ